MIIIKNKIFPFGNFKAITLWPFIFAKEHLTDVDICHEKTHGKQQLECLIIGFYVLYILFWIYSMVKVRNYKVIPFEAEAYFNEHNIFYYKFRKYFAWLKYIL
jgi:hypothetical protein